jgi:hypothetical protein
MVISIVKCKTYEIYHLRRQDTIKAVPSGFYFEMVSRQSYHNDVFVAKLKHKLRHEILELLGNYNIIQFKFNYYQRQDNELFSIAKCLIATLYPGCSNVNDGNSLIPYMVGFTSTNSFKTNTITGNSSYAKELLDKALAMIVVPLFNDDDESLELFIQMNGAKNKRHTISSTLTKGDAYIALCKNEKRKCRRNSLSCGIHCGVNKLTHAEQFFLMILRFIHLSER